MGNLKFRYIFLATLLLTLGFILGIPNKVQAATTCIWTGAVNANWSNSGNWTSCGGTVPQNGDSVDFSSGTYPSTNDIVGLTVTQITSSTGLANVNLGNINLGTGGLVVSSNFPNFSGNITLSGNSTIQTVSGSAALGISGSIDLNGFNLDINAGGSGMNFSSNITGTGNITKSGNANANMDGTGSYAGTTTITGGFWNSGTNSDIPDFSQVSISLAGTLDLQNNNEQVGCISGAGNVNLGSGQLTLASCPFFPTVFSGNILGTGSLVYNSGGNVWTMTGAGTYTGTTTVTSGTVFVDGGSIALSTVNASTGGQISVGGNGSTGNINLTQSHFNMTRDNSDLRANSGDFNTSGPLNLFDVKFNTTALGGFSELNVTGTVTLTNTNLVTATGGSYAPHIGDVFRIINNDGVDPISGTFNGLPEGGLVDVNGAPAQISYVGGTGNDVTLTVLSSIANVALTSNHNPSTLGQSITFTTTLTGNAGTPTGTVQFFDGVTSLGTQTLNGSGQASVTVSNLTLGSHNITVLYSGDTNYGDGGTLTPLVQVVNPVLSKTGVTVNTTLFIALGLISSLGIVLILRSKPEAKRKTS